ncbi:MAG: aldo/keto reductase, partial [Phenylobacterium sp.]|nr:aldo/keto reductase [Phenylobacterium sp.]
MKMRSLGGLTVSEIGFGCMGLDFSYGHRISHVEG